MSREIFVYGGWESLGKDIMIGTLRADVLRGKEVFSSATVSEIKENIASWSYIARGLGIGNSEISMMGKCFKSKFH